MRPIRVEIEGFSTFRERTEIDFGDTDLLAFVGPTGSGKSSIIDAITFALYGSVARYDDARLVAPVISQGANEAKVRLDFELAGRTYVAARVVRRTKTGATTREARLELADPEPDEAPVLANGAKELTDEVSRRLGLDFVQFTRTVVLPQGEFAEFLKDDKASRQKLLRRLLDLEVYSRMGAAARQEATVAGRAAEVYQRQIDENAEVSAEALAERQARAEQLAALSQQVTAQLAEVNDIEARLVDLRTEVATIDANVESLAVVRRPESLDVGDLGRSRKRLEQARAVLDQARVHHDERRAEAAAAGDISRLQGQLAARDQLDEVNVELEGLEAEHQKAEKTAAEASDAEAAAGETLTEAERAREAAMVGAKAADWAGALVAGQPCPVCRQDVVRIPDHDPQAELATAERGWVEAKERAADAAQHARAASASVSGLEARLTERRTGRRALVETLADAPADPAVALAEAKKAHEDAVAAGEVAMAAEKEVRAVEADLRRAESREGELRRAFGAQRDVVAGLEPPPPAAESLAADWEALEKWAHATTASLGEKRTEVAARGKTEAAAKARLEDQITTAARAVGLAAGLDDLPAVVSQAEADVKSEIDRLTARLDDLAQWQAKRDELAESGTVHATLGRLLSASGFERWLLSEALDDLVARATVLLHELSTGQYSLAVDDGDFTVVDHRNADEPRDVRTLSGGETFLASLALALALADSIAELAPIDSPRLGSMFLDEGFGTLDAETLDVVASAIEELSATGRLVGIVTHIEGLAERMPVQIAVSKGPTTSTVERRIR